jgi:AcrR family transcriptional regulator
MARTQAADYEERRERILTQAAQLYARHGFLGASVSQLAAACAISKSALYHYYPSKEDILFDVMHSHVMALAEAAHHVAQGRATAPEGLRALARAFMGLYAGAADRHKVLLNELENLPLQRRCVIVDLQRGLIAQVERLLVEIEPGLKAHSGLVRPAALLFFGMINWTHTWFDPEGPISAGEIADMAVDLTLGGLTKIV